MKRVLILYGGRSGEHGVSCLSVRSVLEVLDRDRYEPITVGITPSGRWTLTDGAIEAPTGRELPEVDDHGPTVTLIGTREGPRLLQLDHDGTTRLLPPVDVAFPVLHGPFGEDGTVQGLFTTVDLPYVGADVTASAIGIDKPTMKAVFARHELPQVPYVVVDRGRWDHDAAAVTADLEARLALPWFAKPARQGSSIGITKVDVAADLGPALEEAFRHDPVALVEQGVAPARELEVGVLGNDQVEVTRPGEIVPAHEFYDFDAKYLDDSQLVIPAPASARVAADIDRIARTAYRAIGCRGMARIDFFVTPDERVVVNEINTIPGFTPHSMFPLLWAEEGLAYPALVDRLLELALEGTR